MLFHEKISGNHFFYITSAVDYIVLNTCFIVQNVLIKDASVMNSLF